MQTILDTSYPEYLRAKYENAQGRLEDIESLSIFAKPYRTLESLLSELVLLGELYGQQVGAESDEREQLILSSIHQAKGLEWRIVFLIRVAEGSFPSTMALRDPQGEEEERRVFYVAATRAQEELYFTYPVMHAGYDSDGSLILQPSRFLQEIDTDLYEQADVEEVD